MPEEPGHVRPVPRGGTDIGHGLNGGLPELTALPARRSDAGLAVSQQVTEKSPVRESYVAGWTASVSSIETCAGESSDPEGRSVVVGADTVPQLPQSGCADVAVGVLRP